MARLPTGTPATPAKVRQAGYRERLKEAGGRRVLVDLEKEGADALAECERRGLTMKAAITQGLTMLVRARP